jgi:lysophospholipase L1-like esterase
MPDGIAAFTSVNSQPEPPPAPAPATARPWSFFTWVGYFVCTLVLVIIVLEIGARIALAVWPRFKQPTVTDIVPGNPAYAAFPWAAECMQEQVARQKDTYFPFRLWGVAETHGSCINNDATGLGVVRRTINLPNPACASHAKMAVWVLGGSAVYGTLIPDWATLPSSLSRGLNTSSRCVEVTNLGVEGYNSSQELLFLIEKLKTGRVPDVVIFYDGFNDADAGTSPAGPYAHLRYMTMKHRMEGGAAMLTDILRRFAIFRLVEEASRPLGRVLPRVSSEQLPARATATLDNYVGNLKIARKLGEAYGFKVCAFWQPAMIYGHKPLVKYEQQLLDLASTPAFSFQPLAAVYREAQQRSQRDGQFVFPGNILDSNAQPIYLDWVHLNPAGNQIAAQAVAEQVGTSCMN